MVISLVFKLIVGILCILCFFVYIQDNANVVIFYFVFGVLLIFPMFPNPRKGLDPNNSVYF